jgi:diadenylate cyclase
MTLVDYVEILILTWLVYILIRFVRETRALQLLKGIFFIFIVSLLLQNFDFKVLGVFSETIINVGVIAAIVMFQPELRRVLEKMGRTQIVKSIAMNFEAGESHELSVWISQIAASCEMLSRKAIGALIVIERGTKLGEQVNTGTVLNALPSSELFGNIFHPQAPLHDGAVIVRDGRILAAGCFLPKPQKEELISKDLGSRHRAAIGLSEVSDAVIIVVSEETGTISIAKDGTLNRGFDEQKLLKYLIDEFMPEAKKKVKKNKNKSSKSNKSKKSNKKKSKDNSS